MSIVRYDWTEFPAMVTDTAGAWVYYEDHIRECNERARRVALEAISQYVILREYEAIGESREQEMQARNECVTEALRELGGEGK